MDVSSPKKSASDSHLFILFPETKLFPKNIIFPIVPLQFLQFVSAKYLILFNLTFCHLFLFTSSNNIKGRNQQCIITIFIIIHHKLDLFLVFEFEVLEINRISK